MRSWKSSFNSGRRVANHSSFVVTFLPSNVVSGSGRSGWLGSLSNANFAGSIAGAGDAIRAAPRRTGTRRMGCLREGGGPGLSGGNWDESSVGLRRPPAGRAEDEQQVQHRRRAPHDRDPDLQRDLVEVGLAALERLDDGGC